MLGVPALVKEGGEIVDATRRLDGDANVVGDPHVVAGGAWLLERMRRVIDADLRAPHGLQVETDSGKEMAERGKHQLLGKEALEARRLPQASQIAPTQLGNRCMQL